MKEVQFPCQIMKIETRTDGSIKVIIETQELSGSDMAELFSYRNALGYCTFTPNPVNNVNVPSEIVEDFGKSKSEILRGVLWHLWSQKHKAKYDTFDLFYKVTMEKIINQFKDLLDV